MFWSGGGLQCSPRADASNAVSPGIPGRGKHGCQAACLCGTLACGGSCACDARPFVRA